VEHPPRGLCVPFGQRHLLHPELFGVTMAIGHERVEGQLGDLLGREPADFEPSLVVGVVPLDGEVRPWVRVGRVERIVPQEKDEPFSPG
jgi:hypothetical protein